MSYYKAYINPKNGEQSQATDEQIENEPDQILVVAGVQAVTPPPIWFGEYKGELLFYPWKLESLAGADNLSIRVNNIILRRIVNNSYDSHIFTIEYNGVLSERQVGHLFKSIMDLREIK